MTEPFLRWAGGKRWLARRIYPFISSRLVKGGTYFEPFLGSGAMFFCVEPKKAFLSDLNEDLITTYRQVKLCPKALVSRLARMPSSRKVYERVRSWAPKSKMERAVRFIYLNRNCYGGLYRENQTGHFNVPFGGGERNHKGLCKDGRILSASSALRVPNVELRKCDFKETLILAKNGDVVYCDPTYREVNRRQFDRYGKTLFTWEDQEHLSRMAIAAYRRGAVVIISNTTCDGIRDLYLEGGIIKIERPKGLGPRGRHRDLVEYLIVLDPSQEWSFWESLGRLLKPWRRMSVNFFSGLPRSPGFLGDCVKRSSLKKVKSKQGAHSSRSRICSD